MSMKGERYGAGYWSEVARRMEGRYPLDEFLCEQKKNIHLDLISRWADIASSRRILKTDLFEEALGADQFLFDLTRINGNTIGIDFSDEIASKAKRRSKQYSTDSGEYVCCDVRHLPFKTNSIGLVISNSTLDHFPDRGDIIAALQELRRVLHVGGTLILTIDNKANLTYPPYIFIRVWMLLRLAPYFIGKTLSPNELRRALGESGFRVEESTAILHYPHPAALVPLIVRFLHWLGKGKLDSAFRKSLTFLDKLEGKRTKYLTGRYIAVKAVKVEIP